ncbi:MAG: hypothetical protein ABIE55_04470 [Candidatus Aenigmatarchaeota archaeon]
MMALDKLVLLVIFLIVIVVGALLVTGNILPFGEDLNLQNEMRNCCIKYRAYGCPTSISVIQDIQCIEEDPSGGDLYTLAFERLKIQTVKDLEVYCSCPPKQ